MNSYSYTPIVTEKYSNSSGQSHTHINPDRLEQFKSYLESHVAALTSEVQILKQHANWIEPRLHEFIAFNQWMEKAHPDIIDAYKKSTAVAKTLDKANHDENAIVAGVAL